MRRRLSLLIAFVGVLGLLGLNPAAQADHDGGGTAPKKDLGKHEGPPTPPVPDAGNIQAECLVQGTVSIGNSTGTGGVDATSKQHNHYNFQEAIITCASNPVNDPAGLFTGAFSVDATGGTDGPSSLTNPTSHGEDDAMGWSHSDCYAGACTTLYELSKGGSWDDLYDGTNINDPTLTQCTNCGEISVSNATTGLASVGVGVGTDNWVKFVRTGNQVIAWGALNQTSPIPGPVSCFLAHLNFTPENGGVGTPKPKIDAARLDGTATVWDAKGLKSNCAGGKGDK